MLDGQGVVQLWSPALQRLTGRTPAEADGRALGPLLVAARVGGGPVDAFRAGRELLRPDSPTATVELVLTRPDGEQRSARCAHARVFGDDGQLERDVVIVHDVTREREVERLKADFIATVSHELRTPVTPIKGYADLLRKRGHTMTADKRDECLAVISDRATHLARLVEDLLLASRISATQGTGVQGTGVQGTGAQVDLALADLVPLVVRACGDFGDDGARVVLDVPPATVEVDCDRIRVIQVLSNLVGNALKYSSPGAPVQVCLRADATAAVVEVVDRGRGIPIDQLERVFEKFHRVEDPMRMTTGGTGLGLYIARQLAEAMGGSLACTSTLGAGSVFTFTLPRACVAPAAGGGGAGAPAGPAASAWVGSRRTPPWAVPPRRSVAAGPLSVRTLG